MASSSETGHAKNVANFEDLITRIESLGTAYNPTKPGIALAALNTKLTAAAQSLLAIANANPPYAAAVDARELAFAPLNKLVTRAINMFKVSVENTAEVDTAVSLAKKVRGSSAPKSNPEIAREEPAKTHSSSQQSYDMVISNFEQLIAALAAHPAYDPNEEDLKIENLQTLLADLKIKSQAVTAQQTALDAIRTNRNNLLYTPGSGIIDTAKDVKTYIKAAFTPNTAQYTPILSLEFRKP